MLVGCPLLDRMRGTYVDHGLTGISRARPKLSEASRRAGRVLGSPRQPGGVQPPGSGDDPDPAAWPPLQLGEERPGLARGLTPGLGASGSLTGTVSSAVVELAAVPVCHDNDERCSSSP